MKNEFVDIFNTHFNQNNLPNQLKHGAQLIGRWMVPHDKSTTEIFALWEYESYENYVEIERKIRNDAAHVQRVHDWYEMHGGKEYVMKNYLLDVRNEEVKTTLTHLSSMRLTFTNGHGA